jgi:hypothetical protein
MDLAQAGGDTLKAATLLDAWSWSGTRPRRGGNGPARTNDNRLVKPQVDDPMSRRRLRGSTPPFSGSPMGRVYWETTPAMVARVTAALDERIGRALAVAV